MFRRKNTEAIIDSPVVADLKETIENLNSLPSTRLGRLRRLLVGGSAYDLDPRAIFDWMQDLKGITGDELSKGEESYVGTLFLYTGKKGSGAEISILDADEPVGQVVEYGLYLPKGTFPRVEYRIDTLGPFARNSYKGTPEEDHLKRTFALIKSGRTLL